MFVSLVSSHSSAITSIQFWHQAMRWEEVRCLKPWLIWLNGRVPSMGQSAWRCKWENNYRCVSSLFFSFFGSVAQLRRCPVFLSFWTMISRSFDSLLDSKDWKQVFLPQGVMWRAALSSYSIRSLWGQKLRSGHSSLKTGSLHNYWEAVSWSHGYTIKSVVKSLAASQHPLSFCLLFRSLATFSQCFQRQKASR